MIKSWDQHLHTEFSGDSETPVMDMINKAKELGLPGITVTDHSDPEYKEVPGKFDLDIENYTKTIPEIARRESTQDFKIYCGIELGLQPHLVKVQEEIAKSYDFDIIIGSVHQVRTMDPYYKSFYEAMGMKNGYREYYEEMLENVTHFNDFDTLGHMDYIRRYAVRHLPPEEGEMRFEDYRELTDEVMRTLIRKDKSLEVNTGSYRSRLTEPNPSIQYLKRYYELGGRLITIGADAHKPDTVGDHFDELPEMLKNIGFKSYFIYEKRVPREMPLY